MEEKGQGRKEMTDDDNPESSHDEPRKSLLQLGALTWVKGNPNFLREESTNAGPGLGADARNKNPTPHEKILFHRGHQHFSQGEGGSLVPSTAWLLGDHSGRSQAYSEDPNLEVLGWGELMCA